MGQKGKALRSYSWDIANSPGSETVSLDLNTWIRSSKMPTKILSIVLVPTILACLAHSMVLDRLLGELDSNAKECLDGLDACKDDYESANSTTGRGAYDTCAEKLTTKHGPGCRRPKNGNLDGKLYNQFPKVASERRCRELANLHHRPNPPAHLNQDKKIVVAWSWGHLAGQAAESNPMCQLWVEKGKEIKREKEYMVWGERI